MVVASPASGISFSDDAASRRLAVRIRKAYKNVLKIIEYTKLRKPRKVALVCSQLVNSKVAPLLPHTSTFSDLVSYHVSSGKFRKNSYRIFLRVVPSALTEMERHIKRSMFLFDSEVTVKAKNSLTIKRAAVPVKKTPTKPTHTFNALEDLDRIKQLVVDRTEPEPVLVEKQKKPTVKHVLGAKKQKTQEDQEPDLSKSVTEDDALVFNALNRERKDVDVELGECKMLKRGVVMLGTHIPNIVWKKVFTNLGLQVIAKQYVTAMYAPVIAAPAEQDGEILEPEVVLNYANQLLALHNRKQTNDCKKLAVVGEPFKLNNASHWWYLALPLCVVNHASFRFGKWHFTKPPRARTAHAAQVVSVEH